MGQTDTGSGAPASDRHLSTEAHVPVEARLGARRAGYGRHHRGGSPSEDPDGLGLWQTRRDGLQLVAHAEELARRFTAMSP